MKPGQKFLVAAAGLLAIVTAIAFFMRQPDPMGSSPSAESIQPSESVAQPAVAAVESALGEIASPAKGAPSSGLLPDASAQKPVAPSMEPGWKQFANAEVVESREGQPDANRLVERIRVVKTDMKYPNVRIVEKLRAADPTGEPVSFTAAVADHMLVRVHDGLTEEKVATIAGQHGFSVRKKMLAPDTYLIAFGDVSIDALPQAMEAFNAEANAVQYAEPDMLVFASATMPNDPAFSQLWGMHQRTDKDIDAPEAWDLEQGSSNVVVAVIDTGIDYGHEDLAANMWRNPGEIPGNGIDDDGNGFLDDVYGWDFCNEDSDPYDDNSHGTHCAGTIGAVGNNGIGVAGVNWGVKLMGVKTMNSGGSGYISDAIDAVYYATRRGVRLTSNSWGYYGWLQSMKDAIDNAGTSNVLFVAAAGNELNDNDNNPCYPASFVSANIVSVAATDADDDLAWFSNFGKTAVDLGAPGEYIYSTVPTAQGKYASFSGTSMATPHVAGVAALVAAYSPVLTAAQIKQRILDNTDRSSTLSGKTVTGGRVNAYKSLSGVVPLEPPAAPSILTATPYTNRVELGWTDNATNETAFVVERRSGSSGFTAIATLAANATSRTDTNVMGGVTYVYRVKATNAAGSSAYSSEASATVPGAADAWDPGNDAGEGAILLSPITTNEATHGPHTLSGTDPYDWFKADLVAGNVYNFNSIGGSGDTYADMFRDAPGTQPVLADDDGGGGLMFMLEYLADSTATYYIRVRTEPASGNAAYNIKYSLVEAANQPPTVGLTSPASNAVYQAPASISIAANASDPDGSIAEVKFYNGTDLLSTDTASPYAYAWSGVAAGSYVLTVVATDNSGTSVTSAPVPVVVNAQPTVALTSPSNGASYVEGTAISIAAVASDTDGTINQVSFYDGAILLNTAVSSPFGYSWTNAGIGSHTLFAVAIDNQGGNGTSGTTIVSVVAAQPVLSVTPTNINLQVLEGQDVPAGSFTVSNGGSGTMDYGVSEGIAWLSISPTNGSSSGVANTHTVSYSTAGLATGTYSGTITVAAPGATASPISITVSLAVKPISTKFEHRFVHVFSAEADDYVIATSNIQKKYEGGNIRYYHPIANNKDASITYRFDFGAPSFNISLKANLYAVNFGSSYGRGSLWGSTNGTDWIQVMDMPTPGYDGRAVYAGNLPSALIGSNSLWLQARLYTVGWNITAQWLRWLDIPYIFELVADLSASGSAEGAISGTIDYGGSQTGQIVVVAGAYTNKISAPGAYVFSNLPTPGTYGVFAFRDVNGNNQRDASEPFGEYAGNPVSLTNHLTNVDVTLNDQSSINYGLIAYYPFNSNANDESGSGRKGTNYYGVYTNGHLGDEQGAISLNGTNAYIDIGSGLNPTQFTVTAWVKLDRVTNNLMAIISKLHNLSPHFYKNFEINVQTDTTVRAGIPSGSWWTSFASVSTLGIQTWRHFALTYDGYNGKMYIDGYEEPNQLHGNYAQTDVDITIGARPESLENPGRRLGFFPGSLDDLRIYNRALTSNEIWQLYGGSSGSIAGTVQYSGGLTGQIVVKAEVYNTTLAGPGAYTLTNLSIGSYAITAFCDANGNGAPDAYEPFQSYTNNPVILSGGNVSGVDITITDTDTDGDGLSDAYEYGYGRYQIVTGSFNWVQAKADAEARGGHLATITSAQEWTAIQTVVSGALNQKLWLGGTDEAQEGVWRWVTGESWDFTRWSSGEPSNSDGAENWLEKYADGTWNDLSFNDIGQNVTDYLFEIGYYTDPNNPDTDGDGLTDGQEVNTYLTDPGNPDTDGDGLNDGAEIAAGTNPLNPDSDDDGLSDYYEVVTMPCLDPLENDSDNDGVQDGAEVAAGSDPCDSASGLFSISGTIEYSGEREGPILIDLYANEATPPEYMVIDLAMGPSATSYPVSYLASPPLGGWTDEHKTTKLVMRRIPAGDFTMGSPSNELGRWGEEIQHQVALTKDFYIGVYELTQRQWELVMGNRPSYYQNTNYYTTRPVERVGYNDVRGTALGSLWPESGSVDGDSFMGVLRAKTGMSTFDLPTEAQWEYACRAGTATAFNSGENLTNDTIDAAMNEVGRYRHNGGVDSTQSDDTSMGTAAVGSFLPSAWGLYDMHGNVYEWCLDWNGPYSGTGEDPVGAVSGVYRVVRSGGCLNVAKACRSAFRYYNALPSIRYGSFGFRVANNYSPVYHRQAILNSPGPFTISNLIGQIEYSVSAFMDCDGNGVLDDGEPRGTYALNPVLVTNNVVGVNIELAVPSTGWTMRATHALAEYDSPGSNTVTCEVYYPTNETLLGLGWTVGLPQGWTLASAAGDGSPVANPAIGEILFSGPALTNNPIRFTYDVSVPVGQSGPKSITGEVDYFLTGIATWAVRMAEPNPLIVNPASPYHSSDFRNPKWVIDMQECNRTLSYWRSRGYGVRSDTVDGYEAEGISQDGSRHKADYRAPFWKLDGDEALRVIGYWMAGGYHQEASGADGYAPGMSTNGALGIMDIGDISAMAVAPSTYMPGQQITLRGTLSYSNDIVGLLWRPQLPAGWTIVSVVANGGTPEVVDNEILFTSKLPPSPLEIVYVCNVPGDMSGDALVQTDVKLMRQGTANPQSLFGIMAPNMLQLDTDGDGLPDWVETNTGVYRSPTDTGTDPNNPDTDGDGVLDGDEVPAGTNPNQGSDSFRILSLVPKTGDYIMAVGSPYEVKWSSVAGKTYSVFRATNLTAGFSILRSNVLATPPVNTFIDTLPPDPKANYWIGVE